MSKWADYLISGVWFTDSPHRHVSKVMIHEDLGATVAKGTVMSREDVVKLLKKNLTVITIEWDYTSGNWHKGATVDTEKVNGVEYLRTHRNGTVTDNLNKLIKMTSIV